MENHNGQSMAVINNENRETIDFAQCYETFSENVNNINEKFISESDLCIARSEAARTDLHENTAQKDKLEEKVQALTAKLNDCSDKEVSEYFSCHDSNVRNSLVYILHWTNFLYFSVTKL